MVVHESLALLTDLYQLTMAQAYFTDHKTDRATFSLFIRSYPLNRGFFISAGLHDVLEFLETFALDGPALDYLSTQNLFTNDFLKFLEKLRFTGDVWAVPEGQLFFRDEPVLEVTAPIIEAQLVETFIINQINLQSLIATKAARCVHAAGRRSVVDFAMCWRARSMRSRPLEQWPILLSPASEMNSMLFAAMRQAFLKLQLY
jgi:nicotinate phosphoribosyltransferase